MKNIWLTRGIFSLNSFVAAMLALYIALSLGMTNPFWSMMTVYIVSQPQAGSVRSKALYRLLGTMIGGAAAVTLVPNLVNSPELLSVALSLWVGCCLSIALLDRTPRSYVFMLSGYTAALIGFPSVSDPGGIFELAVVRVEEIGLGITCATIIHSIFNPQGMGSTLTGRIVGFMQDAQAWTLDALAGRHDSRSDHAHKLAADITALHILATHLPFDTSDFHTKSREVHSLSERMTMLLPLAATVGDRLDTLQRQNAMLSPQSEQLIADIAQWVSAGIDAPIEAADPLIRRARALEPSLDAAPRFEELVSVSFHCRLAELVQVYRDCRVLGRHIIIGQEIPADTQNVVNTGTRRALHRDYGMAAWSGFAAVAATLLVCTFWIMTGWHDGGTAAMMTAIFMCFFAALDDPAKAIDSFALYTVASLPISAVYLFAILPPLDSFPMLALALAPFLLISGALAAIPAWTGRAVPVVMGVAGSLAIQETFTPDFAHFANSSFAMVGGVIAASAITRLIRSVGADFSARRIIRRSWLDIARAAVTRSVPAQSIWIGRMVDRVGLLGPRLAASNDASISVADTMRDLRTGLNILILRQLDDDKISPEGKNPVGALLDDLHRYFSTRSPRSPGPKPLELLHGIDAAIVQTSKREPSPARREGLLALTGLRRNLFPESIAMERAAA